MTLPDLLSSLSALGLAPPALVLDLGCGTGLAARALARAGFRVVGADVDLDAVQTAHALGRTDGSAPGGEDAAATAAVFVAARAESLPLADAAFDAVVCLDVLHWAADEAEFRMMWAEAWRMLKPGGLLAARCLTRDENAGATPASAGEPRCTGAGRFRLASGAEWFLPSRPLLEDALAHGVGVWAEPPRVADTPGAARFIARKPG